MEDKNFELRLGEIINRQIVQSYDQPSREVKINIPLNSVIKLVEAKNV